MKSIKTLIVGGLIAGTVLASGTPAMARDRDHDRWDNRNDHRWGWYARDSRNNVNYRDAREALFQARQKYEYDQSHHASRKKLAADQTEIDRIEQSMGWFRR